MGAASMKLRFALTPGADRRHGDRIYGFKFGQMPIDPLNSGDRDGRSALFFPQPPLATIGMSQFFDFEADFVDSLRCIPMVVRFKLDTSGIKLKLAVWHQFSPAERSQLVDLPCETPEEIAAYRDYLTELIRQHTGDLPTHLPIDSPPAWLRDREIPSEVKEKARIFNLDLNIPQWAQIAPLQRFALIKLSRSQHENANFLPALKEFGLLGVQKPRDNI